MSSFYFKLYGLLEVLEARCQVYEVAAGFREWQRDLMNLPARKDVHVGVVAAGTCARLGGRILQEGLLQIAAVPRLK